MKKIISISAHLLFWTVSTYFIVETFSFNREDVIELAGGETFIEKIYDKELRLAILYTTLLKVLIYYFNLYFLSKLLFEKKYIKYASIALLIVFAALLSDRVIVSVFACICSYSNGFQGLDIGLHIFYFAISTAHGFFNKWKKDDISRKKLEEDKVTAELKLLRSQINPHFLFNSLNNLMSISERGDKEEVSEGLARLSDLLRFMLYDCSDEMVLLNKEIEFIENYVALNKLRFDKKDAIDIRFKVSVNEEGIYIVPAILIPLVENAFKHGINIYKHSFVDMELVTDNEKNIVFKIENSVHKKEHRSNIDVNEFGIGLENVKKRLNILYPKKHIFNIKQERNGFKIYLKIITKNAKNNSN